jgi:hypothetical protein
MWWYDPHGYLLLPVSWTIAVIAASGVAFALGYWRGFRARASRKD